MDASQFMDALFRIERKLDLFADTSNGCHWWDAVRADVYWMLYSELTHMRLPQPAPGPLPARAANALRRLALRMRLRWKMRTSTFDVLAFRAPRQRSGGRLFDAAIDSLLEVCPGRKLIIDTHPYYYHRDSSHVPLGEVTQPALLDALVVELRTTLTVPTDARAFRDFVLLKIAEFLRARDQYERLLERVRPRLLLVCQNGFEKALFVAAKARSIPLVEVQHGLINHAHPAYSYPQGVDYRAHGAFPTHFLAFSAYWIRSCHYPADQSLAIGNDRFFVERSPASARGDVLFIAADIYNDILFPLLCDAAARLPERSFKYKLHPNQEADFERLRRTTSHLPNVQVIDARVAARTLLASAAVVVVVQSTVTHEALQAGNRVCVIPVLNYGIHADLFGLPQVTLTPTVDALIDVIASPASELPPVVFFERFDEVRARGLLRQLLDGDTATARNEGAAFAHASNE